MYRNEFKFMIAYLYSCAMFWAARQSFALHNYFRKLAYAADRYANKTNQGRAPAFRRAF